MGFLLIHGARQLLTLRGPSGPRRGPAMNQLQVIEDGAVLVEGERIREVGPTRRIENLAAARTAREISAAGRVVMPGFIDASTHLMCGPGRLQPDTNRIGPDACLANLTAVRNTSARRLTAEASAALKQCLIHGSTSVESKSGAALNGPGEAKLMRVLSLLADLPLEVVATFYGAHTTPPEFDDPERYIDFLCAELLPSTVCRGVARFVDGHAGAFGAKRLIPYFQKAQELKFDLKLTASQFDKCDGLELLDRFPFTSVSGLEYAEAPEIERLGAAGVMAVLTPALSFFLKTRRPPAREMINWGVAVAIASGFNRFTAPTCNMQMAIFLACHELGMTPAEAISAATINAAHAIKMAHRLGSLEAGKQADLLILNMGDYRELGHEFGINRVSTAVKRGSVVLDSSGVKWPAD